MQDIVKHILNTPLPVVAIDGNCASGKTTLANELSRITGLPVIHADDFFLPPHMRSEERLSLPGGNTDHERMYDEVIKNIGGIITHRIFDCSVGDFAGVREVDTSKGVIIEGAYSLHPAFGKYYTLSVFCEAPLPTRLERIAKRNGIAAVKRFEEKWIPLEDKYFSAFSVREGCNIIYSNALN